MKMNYKNGGFTIAEVLVAIVVVALTIASITFLVIDTISANSANMKSFQASQLSQEGLEMVRNMRDSNWLRNLDWLGSQVSSEDGPFFSINLNDANEDDGNESENFRRYYFIVDHSPNFVAKINDKSQLSDSEMPWILQKVGLADITVRSQLYECEDMGKPIFVHDSKNWNCKNKSLFRRYMVVEPYNITEYKKKPLMVRVRSITEWQGRNGIQRVELVEDLTDWRRSPL